MVILLLRIPLFHISLLLIIILPIFFDVIIIIVIFRDYLSVSVDWLFDIDLIFSLISVYDRLLSYT